MDEKIEFISCGSCLESWAVGHIARTSKHGS